MRVHLATGVMFCSPTVTYDINQSPVISDFKVEDWQETKDERKMMAKE
jgi:hypothetical protein